MEASQLLRRPMVGQSSVIPAGHADEAQTEQSDTYATVTNQTARWIAIRANNDSDVPIELAPFGLRRLPLRRRSEFRLQEWETDELIKVSGPERPGDTRGGRRRHWTSLAVGGIVMGSIIVAIAALAALLLPLPKGWFEVLAVPFGTVAIATALVASKRVQDLAKRIAAILFGLAVPLVAFLLALGGALMVAFPREMKRAFPANPIELVTLGPVLQGVFIIVAATLPALFFYLFTRQKLAGVARKFYRDAMMLDCDVRTDPEAEAKYHDMVRENFGCERGEWVSLRRGVPLLLCTLLMLIGWILAIVPGSRPKDFASYFPPMMFGFLGVYFFSLNMVFRRYLQCDLAPTAYMSITVRLVVTLGLVAAVTQLPGLNRDQSPSLLNAISFVIGVLPESGLALLQEAYRSVARVFPFKQNAHPVTRLDGITLYDRERLLEEGIEDVENLAHSDIFKLMVRTPLCTARLVDLFDQAILYLHLIEEGTDRMPLRKRLREYGVRTATDLLEVTDSATRRPAHNVGVLTILDDLGVDGLKSTRNGTSRLQVIATCMRDDEWLPQITYWRKLHSGQLRTATDPSQVLPALPIRAARVRTRTGGAQRGDHNMANRAVA
jgi:hypothetical protein